MAYQTSLYISYTKEKGIRSIYEKEFKSIFRAAIVLSAVACSTANDEETKTKETKEKVVETKEDTSVPNEYRNALHKAENYSKMMHMSKQRIYDQLTSEYGEKFDAEAAQYAIDNLNADYNENALKCGENYKKTMHMSKARIYDQLTSENGEKFTAEQAQYAIDNIKGDYLEAALKSAKNYQETMNMSKDAIYDQLTSEYGEKFTAEEAQYAIDNLDD